VPVIRKKRSKEGIKREGEKESSYLTIHINIKMAYPVKYVHDLVPPLES